MRLLDLLVALAWLVASFFVRRAAKLPWWRSTLIGALFAPVVVIHLGAVVLAIYLLFGYWGVR